MLLIKRLLEWHDVSRHQGVGLLGLLAYGLVPDSELLKSEDVPVMAHGVAVQAKKDKPITAPHDFSEINKARLKKLCSQMGVQYIQG